MHFPARSISISFHFVDTIFIENSHKAMSITKCGSAVIWSDVLVEQKDEPHKISSSFKKENIKSIKLSDFGLVDIKSIDGYVMIADDSGQIRFYDDELKIVHWCPSYDADSIITISFDLVKPPNDENNNKQGFSIRDFLIGNTKNQHQSTYK